MAGKLCGECRFFRNTEFCPKVRDYSPSARTGDGEYRIIDVACLPSEKACELFQPKFNPDQFNAKALGDHVKKKHRFFSQNERDNIWTYNPEKGVWKPNGTEVIQAEALKLLGDEFKRDRVQEAIKYISIQAILFQKSLGDPRTKQ